MHSKKQFFLKIPKDIVLGKINIKSKTHFTKSVSFSLNLQEM